MPELPTDFTFSFWMIMINDNLLTTNSFDLINAFGRIYFTSNLISGSQHIVVKVVEDLTGV